MSGAISLFLKEAIGLHGETMGASAVDHAIKQRMSACNIADVGLYWQHLTTSVYERQELIEAVIVPETWFFRDREAFAAITHHLRGHRGGGQPVRVLSIPCSTGEEPYSIAMSLFDAGYGADAFGIDAIDVSMSNLAKAKRALYGRNSFRGGDLGFRDRYFDHAETGFQLDARIRGQVTFTRANLFEWTPAAGQKPYDLIFCRNLLIYFDRETQERALRRLAGWLAPDGLLLVGPGESGLPTSCGFISAGLPRAFAFRKADNTAKAVPSLSPPGRTAGIGVRRKQPALAIERRTARPIAGVRTVPAESDASSADPAASLAAIQRAADAGKIEHAKEAGAVYLAQFGPSSELFYLMGLVHDAGGASAEAIQYYRKALYLAPDHPETLAHLALLLRSRGDIAAAKALDSRLARIEKRSDRP